MPHHNTPRLCFIGFGEAGQAIASGLRETGIETIAAWDILFPNAEGANLKQAGEKMGARVATSAADAQSEPRLSLPEGYDGADRHPRPDAGGDAQVRARPRVAGSGSERARESAL